MAEGRGISEAGSRNQWGLGGLISGDRKSKENQWGQGI